jgi:hypothetical protein
VNFIVDYERPTIICPDDVILECNDPVPAINLNAVFVLDNCSDASEITKEHVEDIIIGTGCNQVIRRIYKATDACGNSALCVQIISYANAAPSFVEVAPSLLLEGAFDQNGGMSNSIYEILPLDQPYDGPGYDYQGTESVQGMPEGVIDWVLLDLRLASDMTVVVARKAALLKDNGEIIDTDGTMGVKFEGVAPGDYYITVCQRNHLDVISAQPVTFGISGVTYYDFTQAGAAMGNGNVAEVQPGVFALYCGDLNCDGVIDAGDRSVAWNLRNTVGYLEGDANMDGVIDATERSITWNNRNKASAVPHE